MKKIFFLAVLVASSTIFTSCLSMKKPIDSPPQRVKKIENNANKDSNFIKANEWMVATFNNAESVIQFTDKEAGIVKGKYIMKKGIISTSAYVASTDPFYAVITIRVKDNAARIEIDAPAGMYSQTADGKEYGFTPETFKIDTDVLIADFEQTMISKSVNDDW